jgi:uncharacterized protein YbjT (DUF2867 family)
MILITGASGRIGRRATELLSEQGLPLRLMSRSPERLPTIPGTDRLYGDFEAPASLDAAFAGITTALVISGKAPPGKRALTHRNAFEAAARAGVRHVVYLSLKGTGPGSPYPYCRDHQESEDFLVATGLPHTLLRVAFYMDMFFDKFDPQGVIRGPAGQGQGAFISREDAARVAAAAIATPPGGILEVTGPELLGVADLARRLSAITGRTLRYEEEAPDAMRVRLGRGGVPTAMQDLEVGWFQAIAAGEQAPVTQTFRQLTGNDPLRLEEYATRYPDRLAALRAGSAA